MDEPSALRLHCLGPVTLQASGAFVAVPQGRPLALLVALALEHGRWLGVEALAGLLWEGDPPASYRNAIQVYVRQLRQALSPLRDSAQRPLQHRAGSYQLQLTGLQIDVRDFESELTGAQALVRSGQSAEAVERLDLALSLWNGEAFEGLRAYPIAARSAVALDQKLLDARALRFECLNGLGRSMEIVDDLHAELAASPYHERYREQLMLALYASQRQAEAIEVYQQGRELLRQELGVDPDPALQDLYQRILQQDPGLRSQRTPPEAQPEKQGSGGPGTATHNLPIAMSSLLGRGDEIERIAELVRHHRLVTLTGPGGIGKTRLASESARRVFTTFPEGAWFVDLAAATQTTEVAAAIAGVLSIRETEEGPERAVLQGLRGRQLLLVLDNLEQVLISGPFIGRLLAENRELRILATSRAPLRIEGERLYEVQPLPVAGPSDETIAARGLAEIPAIALFIDRASAVQQTFALTDQNASAVVDICRRLDGHPLAIELAAARIRLLSPAALLARLDSALAVLTGGALDRPARQQTLRATVAWSYDAAAPHLQRVLARMSVFPGDAALSAIEAICQGDEGPVTPDAMLDAVSDLVDSSLVRRVTEDEGEPRFGLHVGIREFAAEQLEASGETAAGQRRHAHYFANFAKLPLDWSREQEARRLEAVRKDLHNMRAALAYIQRFGTPGDEVGFNPLLWEVLVAQGHYAEALAAAEHVLERHPDPAIGRAEWGFAWAWIRYYTNPRSRDWVGPFREIVQQVRGLEASTHVHTLTRLVTGLDDPDELRGVIAEHDAELASLPESGNRVPVWLLKVNGDGVFSLAMRYIEPEAAVAAAYRMTNAVAEIDDPEAKAVARIRLGMLLCDQGKWTAALPVLKPFERGDFGVGDNWEAEGMWLTARLRLGLGDYDLARSAGLKSRELYRSLGSEAQVAALDLLLAECSFTLGDLEEAEIRVRAALARTEGSGDVVGHAAAGWRLTKIMRCQTGDLRADPPLRLAQAVLSNGEARHLVELLGCLVEVAMRTCPEDAAVILGATVRASEGFVVPFDAATDMRRLAGRLANELGPDRSAQLIAEGRLTRLRTLALAEYDF